MTGWADSVEEMARMGPNSIRRAVWAIYNIK